MDRLPTPVFLGFPYGSAGKESACNMGDLGLIPGLGRSSGERKGYPFQYSGLENSMDCIVHGVTKSRTRLSASLSFCSLSPHLTRFLPKLCPTPCDHMDCTPQAFLSFTISQSSLKLMSFESMMPSNHLILWRPLLLLPSVFPSIRVFSSESALCIMWSKY